MNCLYYPANWSIQHKSKNFSRINLYIWIHTLITGFRPCRSNNTRNRCPMTDRIVKRAEHFFLSWYKVFTFYYRNIICLVYAGIQNGYLYLLSGGSNLYIICMNHFHIPYQIFLAVTCLALILGFWSSTWFLIRSWLFKECSYF